MKGMVRFSTVWAVLILLAAGCDRPEPQSAAPDPEVEVITAAECEVREGLTRIAEVKACDEVQLVARVEGFLRKRHFAEGQAVKAGALLYEIEPEIYAARVSSAEAGLEQARAGLKNAQVEYDRQSTLRGREATSERAYDAAATLKLEAEARVKAAEAQLALARQDLSYTKIYAPFDGWIGISSRSEGNLVNLSSGPLATVVKTDPVRVEFVLGEPDLLALMKSPGRGRNHVARLFTQDGAEYRHPGTVSFWNNQLNTSTGTLRMQAQFPNPDRELVPGMFVRIRLEPRTGRMALTLPEEVLMSDQVGEYVYVVDAGGVVRRRDLATGYRFDSRVVIESGLQSGERVIAAGAQRIRPGTRVTPLPRSEAAAPASESSAPPPAGERK